MPTLFQINVTSNWGSHGKIAERIAKLAIDKGWNCYTAYGRGNPQSVSKLIKIGNNIDKYFHAFKSFILDNQGLNSEVATRSLIKQIESIQPDIIHLHNIHGHYLNYPILFKFLKQYKKPVVWTLHDCWCFTGHCTHFEFDECFKWKTGCDNCNFKRVYPTSIFLERSKRNYNLKKQNFASLNNLTLVPVSNWLANLLDQSFMKDCNKLVIHNGIDVDLFKPQDIYRSYESFNILGIASNWKMRKGLPDFIKLRTLLPQKYKITLIGLSKSEIKELPKDICGIERTNNVNELIELYNHSDLLVNPTYEDNFPTINLESLACGTPVITYRTGGSPEAIDESTGVVIEQGDVEGLYNAIVSISENQKITRENCRNRAVALFRDIDRYNEYIDLYNKLLQ